MQHHPHAQGMNTPRPHGRTTAGLLAWWLAGLALVGCGGGSDASREATHGAANETATALADTQRQASALKVYRWSDAALGLPQTSADVQGVAEVLIPAGVQVMLDVSPPALPRLRIEGALVFEERDLALQADAIQVTGRLQIGTAAAPFQHQARITLTGTPTGAADSLLNDGVSRGLVVNGGKLQLFGAQVPQPAWTQLGDHLAAGATTVQLKEAVNWPAGSTLAVAPTDFRGQSATERATLVAASGAQLTLAAGLQSARWGRLQYVTDQGMRLTPQADFTPPKAGTPTVLDERAEVANLSRNIVIQGADDAAWRDQGFGAHVMVMQPSALAQLDGVEIRRAGQAGKLARYPLHWHLLSYDVATGAERGDATGHFVRNSAIWDSAQRCIVLHSTNGVKVQNNICHAIKGHAIFLEDATERRNLITDNLVLGVDLPAQPLKFHEMPEGVGPAGLWITNPDNQILRNHAADAYGPGLWLAFANRTLGLSRKVNLVPRHLPLGVVDSNTAHSNGYAGQVLGQAPEDDDVANPELTLGRIGAAAFAPMRDGLACDHDYCDYQIQFNVTASTLYKNGINGNAGAYRNQAKKPFYDRWVTADNVGMHFSGSVEFGQLQRVLLVGHSLNAGKGYPTTDGVAPPTGLATYHSAVKMVNNVLVNFPLVPGSTSGAFSTEDYYLRPVEKGTQYNAGNRLIQTHPGYHSVAPAVREPVNPAASVMFAGALWDPYGYWGPKNNYLTFNAPFFSAGLPCVKLDGAVAGDGANTVSCAFEPIGVTSLHTDDDAQDPFIFRPAIQAKRYNAAGQLLGTLFVGDGFEQYRDPTVAANYRCSPFVTPPAGNYCAYMLGHMRHFTAVPGDTYELSFPSAARAPRYVEFLLANAWRPGTTMLMSVHFDGRVPAVGYNMAAPRGGWMVGLRDPSMVTAGGELAAQTRVLRPVATLAEVLADTTGRKLWQDKANNRVWFKHVAGSYTAALRKGAYPGTDEAIYFNHNIVLGPRNVCTGATSREECLARISALP